MASTNFRVFNEANAPANTYNDSEYQNATQRQSGVIPGMAISRMHNKMYYQWSTMATAIAQYLVSRGYDCNDNDIAGIVDALENSCGLNIRQDSTAYEVGDIAYSAALSSVLFLECTTAGTTASSIPAALTGAAEGDSITDGTVVWIVRKIASMADVRAASPGQRQASTSYAVDDMASLGSLPYGWYLLCTTAGTTSSSPLVISTPAVGDTVNDGTVTWTIRKISSGGDGVPLGTIIAYSANGELPAGYLLCDGSAVSRTMFPDLFAAIGTTYGAGDGSTTFNLPDYNTAERFAQGSTVAGTVKSAGLPNITGNVSEIECHKTNMSQSGALSYTTPSGGYAAGAGTGNLAHTTIGFNANSSNPIYGASDTVQPNALTVRYIIKAFDGQTADSALIDITQYANELVAKADCDLDNLTTAGIDVIKQNSGGTPTGTIIEYASNGALPDGYLACDGSAVSRTTYADLFAAIGTTWGAGDGSTTFNLPNLIDKWAKGSGTAGTDVSAGLPNITGSIGRSGFEQSPTQSGALYAGATSTISRKGSNDSTPTICFDASRSNSIYGASSTVSVASKTVRYIIKY